MATNKKALKAERRHQVNSTQCCICFKIRSAVLLTVCVSLCVLIGYGFKYWEPSMRDSAPVEWHGYAIMIGVELCISVLGCIAVLAHHRTAVKLFAFCTCVFMSAFIVAVLFQVAPMLQYLHFAFHLVWIVLQLVLLLLLWKYSQLLKVVYGWDDRDEDWDATASPDTAGDAGRELVTQPALPPPASSSPKTNNGASVNVSINLTMPAAQPAPVMYAPPPQAYPMYQQPYSTQYQPTPAAAQVYHVHAVEVDSQPDAVVQSEVKDPEVHIMHLEQEGVGDANGIATTAVQQNSESSDGGTPEPPPPPVQQNSEEALADDFIADVEPDGAPRMHTHDVKLYFLGKDS